MRLITLLFANSTRKYKRMLEVLRISAAENHPSSPLEVLHITKRDLDLECQFGMWYTQNARKTRHQARIVEEAKDGEILCLIDSDTMVLRTLSPANVFMQHHDLAYTLKPPKTTYKINSGVLFVRVSDVTRGFFANWADVVKQMVTDRKLYLQYKPDYGGINQAGLGHMLTTEHGLRIKELQCREWNSIRETWDVAVNEARVVHILARLRDHCIFQHPASNAAIRRLSKMWREYEIRAKALGRMHNAAAYPEAGPHGGDWRMEVRLEPEGSDCVTGAHLNNGGPLDGQVNGTQTSGNLQRGGVLSDSMLLGKANESASSTVQDVE